MSPYLLQAFRSKDVSLVRILKLVRPGHQSTLQRSYRVIHPEHLSFHVLFVNQDSVRNVVQLHMLGI
jgi:hypothetical protein